jgi:hypothetical protein
MQVLYRKIFEVEINHDYFLLPGGIEKYSSDYSVATIFSIRPSPDTIRLLRDLQMIFRTTASGFVLLIKSQFIKSTNVYISSVDFTADLCFTFIWTLKDPYFLNYTNQRVSENDKKIYYFSNRNGSTVGTVNYLNRPVPSFGTTYLNEPLYRLGDIVKEGGATFELIEKESPVTNFPANAALWQKINTAEVNYVNPDDRLSLQGSRYVYARPNTNPGEFITARLLDANNHEVPLGSVTGTGLLQNEYRTSRDGGDPVNFILDFSRLNPGFYTLEMKEMSGITRKSFYLMDPMLQNDLYGVSSFFVSGTALPFRFISEDPASKRWKLDDPPKKFTIRFRNRLTRWKYLNQDESLFNQPPAPRPLTRSFSGYTVPGPAGTTINLPDPEVSHIYPELEGSTGLIKNIYSKIFLTK